jgi:hypothetical protein
VAEAFKLGAEVEAWCTKCKEMQVHHVLSLGANEKPARVRCNHCDGEHNYRPSPPQTRRSSAPSKSSGAKKKVGLALTDEQKQGARPYQMSGVFQRGDVISHPTFGFGEVTEIRSAQRMVVLFDTSQKLLVFNTRLSS